MNYLKLPALVLGAILALGGLAELSGVITPWQAANRIEQMELRLERVEILMYKDICTRRTALDLRLMGIAQECKKRGLNGQTE